MKHSRPVTYKEIDLAHSSADSKDEVSSSGWFWQGLMLNGSTAAKVSGEGHEYPARQEAKGNWVRPRFLYL